jgi:hypothetical protein
VTQHDREWSGWVRSFALRPGLADDTECASLEAQIPLVASLLAAFAIAFEGRSRLRGVS